MKFQGPVTLSGGIDADHVLFNVLSSGNNNVQSSGNYLTNQVFGDLIDLKGTWNVNEISINGRWFGAESGGTYQLVSNGHITAPSTPKTPEPGSLAWMIAGLVALITSVCRKPASLLLGKSANLQPYSVKNECSNRLVITFRFACD